MPHDLLFHRVVLLKLHQNPFLSKDCQSLIFPLTSAIDKPLQRQHLFSSEIFLGTFGIEPGAAGSGSKYANHSAMLLPKSMKSRLIMGSGLRLGLFSWTKLKETFVYNCFQFFSKNWRSEQKSRFPKMPRTIFCKNFSRRRKFFFSKMIWHSKQASEETQDGEVSQAQNI